MKNRKEKLDKTRPRWMEASNLEDEGKIEAAMKIYLEEAKLGDSIAQSNLANLFDDKIQPPDPKKAVYWYKRAIHGGSSIAAWNLAMHYRNRGKRRWYLHWLNVAASMGDEDAIAEMNR